MNINFSSTVETLFWRHEKLRLQWNKVYACVGVLGLLLMTVGHIIPTFVLSSNEGNKVKTTPSSSKLNKTMSERPAVEWAFGGYGGITYTHPSTVEIKNSDRTDMAVKDFGWIGRPFKAPIYYGVRIQRWHKSGYFGSMLDFTHAKAIAQREDEATFSGTLNGEDVKENKRIGDVFRHLEFSHGHNMLTLNALARLTPVWSRFRPYFGLGAGVSLPHTEVGIHKENARTYEYQFAGFAGQGLAGLEIQFGHASIFLEYKFTYAPYDIPLSHEPYGWLLVTDLWRQLSSWWNGERPAGGRLTTTLATHHGVAGVMLHKNKAQHLLLNKH